MTELWVLKSRNTGQVGKVQVVFDHRTQTLSEVKS